jgi:transcription factor IIIB 90 kDa subunit
LQSGKKRIERMAAQLNIKSHLATEAFNYFRLAVNRHMTQGRNSEHFAAACLYIACRINANSEMGNYLAHHFDILDSILCFLANQC